MYRIELSHVFGVFVEEAHEFLFVKSRKSKHCCGRLKLVGFFIPCSCHKAEVAVSGAVDKYIRIYVHTCPLADDRDPFELAVIGNGVAKLAVEKQSYACVKTHLQRQKFEFVRMYQCYRIVHRAALMTEGIPGLFKLGYEFLGNTAYDLSAGLRKIPEKRKTHCGVPAEVPVALTEYNVSSAARRCNCGAKTAGTAAYYTYITFHISYFHNKNAFHRKSVVVRFFLRIYFTR